MKKTILSILTLVLITFTGIAETPDYIYDGALIDGKTTVKADLMGLGVRNYTFSTERIINRKLSINLGVRFMPSGGIPMFSVVENFVGSDIAPYLTDVTVRSFAFTPELRIYLGENGYGRGFYLAPYYNYFNLNIQDYKYEHEMQENGNPKIVIVNLNGNFKANSGGLMLGYQWLLGPNRNIVIDWGILGIHAGVNTAVLDGNTNYTLSEKEQASLREGLDNNLDNVKYFKFTSKVGANDATVNEKGPWAFLRGSISIGFRF